MKWVVYDTKEGLICCESGVEEVCVTHKRYSKTPRQMKVMEKADAPKAALKAWNKDLEEAQSRQDWDRLANHGIHQERTYLQMLEDQLMECRDQIKSLQKRIARERLKVAA